MSQDATVKGVGISVSEEGMGSPAVLLEARNEVVPIFIGAEQARSIQLAHEGLPSERPMTHDLLIEMITEFGGAIDSVRIDDLADNTFYAKIDAERYLNSDRQEHVFDARPSDGVALALRVDCPITISDEVIDATGQPTDAFEIEDDDFDFDSEPTGM